jgi:hypothetical protein
MSSLGDILLCLLPLARVAAGVVVLDPWEKLRDAFSAVSTQTKFINNN